MALPAGEASAIRDVNLSLRGVVSGRPGPAVLIPGLRRRIREVRVMVQQGQVFRLKATRADGEALWAYRYRVAGRGSARFQVGGFSTRAEAQRALQKKLARLGLAI